MKKSDKNALLVIGTIFIWILGSSVVGGFLHGISESSWMDWIIIIFVVGFGIALVWAGIKIKPYI